MATVARVFGRPHGEMPSPFIDASSIDVRNHANDTVASVPISLVRSLSALVVRNAIAINNRLRLRVTQTW